MSEFQSLEEEQHYGHLSKIPEWPKFDLFIEFESGRIPVTKVRGWRHFSKILEEDFFNRFKEELVYRGNRRFDWPLTPSLGRLDHRGIITGETAEAQIEFFRKAVRGRLLDRSLVETKEEEELWAVGQHHGLMTPLLDWTYSPYVALFFAFEDFDDPSEQENPYRTIYVLSKTYVERTDNPIYIVEPRKDDHGRLVNQAGLFTKSDYGQTLEVQLINSLQEDDIITASEDEEAAELAKYICKIYIPNEDRDECIQHLRRMNVHHASLFPDLLGASEHTNTITSELKKIEDIEQSELEVEDEESQKEGEKKVVEAPESLTELIEQLIKKPEESKQVEAGRIRIISKELAQVIQNNKIVDWIKRENIQAQLRVKARVILRKYGYPKNIIESVSEELIKVLTEYEKEE